MSAEILPIILNDPIMPHSNIFAYTQLSKIAVALAQCPAIGQLKNALKTQIVYFNILEPTFFSGAFATDWETIQSLAGELSQKTTKKGKATYYVTPDTIEALSDSECVDVVDKVLFLFERLRMEPDYQLSPNMMQNKYHHAIQQLIVTHLPASVSLN